MHDENKEGPQSKEALIKSNLRRAFQEKANENIPDDLLALVEKLRMQDEQNGKS